MSFFDNIGSKASAAGQAAAEKARNFAEVNRLSGVISDHEKRISRLYFEIGQSYYERHKDDPEAEELERIAAITDTNEKIAVCRNQIKTLKGVEKCPNCGADVQNGSQFCNNCGTRMPPASMKTAPKAGLTCPTCGTELESDAAFCFNCGTKLAPTPAPAPAPAPAEPAVEELKRSCPNCGTELESDAAFCFNCGTKLGE
ncbi:MAG: zinc ribbon domain-containing protein [Oscillospiraceae bacterium]|nr:zinc ribbon domain-containing protein [Oscillospiraceae bacterium]